MYGNGNRLRALVKFLPFVSSAETLSGDGVAELAEQPLDGNRKWDMRNFFTVADRTGVIEPEDFAALGRTLDDWDQALPLARTVVLLTYEELRQNQTITALDRQPPGTPMNR